MWTSTQNFLAAPSLPFLPPPPPNPQRMQLSLLSNTILSGIALTNRRESYMAKTPEILEPYLFL